MHPDVNIEETSVLSDNKRKEDAIALRGETEIVKHGHTVDADESLSRLHSNYCAGSLTFSETPSCARAIKSSLALLHGKGSTEIIEVDAIKLRNVLHLSCEGTFREVEHTLINVLSKLTDMVL